MNRGTLAMNMSRRVKALAALNVLGWLIAVPILLAAVVDPFVDFGSWPDRLIGGRQGDVQLGTPTTRAAQAPSHKRAAREPRAGREPGAGGARGAPALPARDLAGRERRRARHARRHARVARLAAVRERRAARARAPDVVAPVVPAARRTRPGAVVPPPGTGPSSSTPPVPEPDVRSPARREPGRRRSPPPARARAPRGGQAARRPRARGAPSPPPTPTPEPPRRRRPTATPEPSPEPTATPEPAARPSRAEPGADRDPGAARARAPVPLVERAARPRSPTTRRPAAAAREAARQTRTDAPAAVPAGRTEMPAAPSRRCPGAPARAPPGSARVAELEHGEERLLGDLDAADLLHAPLALLLLLEQLALARDVAAVALGHHVLAEGLDGLAGDDRSRRSAAWIGTSYCWRGIFLRSFSTSARPAS